MGDNHYNFPFPMNNSFYHHYIHQHAIMSRYFLKLHNTPYHNTPTQNHGHLPDFQNPSHVYEPADYSSCSSSSCSCCSSGSCSKSSSSPSSSTTTEYEEIYDDEKQDEEDDESECEYEFNVDAILAMRAAKEELKKNESPEPKDESESDSIVLVDSDKEDFEFIDLSSTKLSGCNLFKCVGKFNRSEERENQKKMWAYLYGTKSATIAGQETALALTFERLYDVYQPPLWPVLPLRL